MKRGKTTLLRIFVIAALSGLCLLPTKLLANPAQSAWLSTDDPVFAIQNQDASNSLPPTFISHGNIDCSNLSFTKREGVILPPLLYKESQLSDCFFDTTAGEVNDNGYISIPGTPYVAETVHPDHTPYKFFAFPYGDVFVSNQSGSPAIGNYVWLSHLRGAAKLTSSTNGKLWAEVTPVTQTPIADKAGNQLPILLDNFGESSDGKWAVVDSPGHGVIRINLGTMELLPFTESLENGSGTGSAIRTAISSDGRYAVIASKAYHYFRIFDLSTCGAVPNVITQPISCQSRDLDSFMRRKVSDLGSILQIRFVTNNQLKIYASYNISSDTKTGQFALAAPGTSLAGMEYLGMGDSFSSGEGSQDYEVGTDDPNNKCHLSKLSYPYLIAKKLNFNSFHSVACSGAVTFNVIGGSGVSDDKKINNRDNQYTNKPAQDSLGYWLPGYDKQIKFVSENQPQLITLSVIGNDLGFGDIAQACAMPGTCYPTYEDRLEIFKNVDSKLDTLTNLYKKLRSEAPNGARIYAVGYPQFAVSTGQCGLNVHMNESELTFASMLISRIDELVKTAANRANIYYADVEDAFFGHRLCEADSGDVAMNGLTAGNDIKGIIGNESYHPNAYGQFLMSQKILGITNNLGTGPINISQNLSQITDTNPALANLPKTGRSLNRLLSLSLPTTVTPKGQPVAININGFNYAMQPNSNYTFSAGSTPAVTAISNSQGDLNLNIPADQPGLETIHITGQDITGQPIDISGNITVQDPNSQTACGVIPASGQDVDKDGIDDACDPNIGPAPLQQPPANPTTPTGTSSTVTDAINSLNITASAATSSGPQTISTTTSAADSNQPELQTASQAQNLPKTPIPTLTPKLAVSKLTQGLKQAVNIASTKTQEVAAVHPLGFTLTVLSLIIALILFIILKAYTSRDKIAKHNPKFALN